VSRKRAEESRSKHDIVSCDCGEQVGAWKTGDKSEVSQEEWGAKGPVDVAEPENLAEGDVVSVWDMFVVVDDNILLKGNSLASGESEVGDEGDCGDQSAGGVKDPLRLFKVSPGLQIAGFIL
jgi:hypothetical protein